MALTREFRETIRSRAERDPAFRKALFKEAMDAYLAGDEVTGKAILKDLIHATIGFEELARLVDKPSKSLHRMLGPSGNPRAANFFAIVRALQKEVENPLGRLILEGKVKDGQTVVGDYDVKKGAMTFSPK